MCCGRPSKKKYRPPKTKLIKGRPLLSAQSILKTILMCRPKYYSIAYSINPWMDTTKKVNLQAVTEQYNTLCDRLEEHGAKLEFVPPREGLPDMIFTANAGLILKESNTVVVSSFRFPERQKEQWWFMEHLMGLKIKPYVPGHIFEGAGDALFLGKHLIGGYGFRSEAGIYDEIRSMVSEKPVAVELVNPNFYHLDTCFCPLNDMDYMIYPGAFSPEGLNAIRELGGNEIEVPKADAHKFACNAVTLGKKVIMPKDCSSTMKKLVDMDYEPVPVAMSEFLKSGGSCKCLTLELLNA